MRKEKNVSIIKYDTTIVVRCDNKVAENFKEWCNSAGKEYQDVIREILIAAPEGRVSIKPTLEQLKALKELYKS